MVFWFTHLIVMFLEINFDKIVERLERFIYDMTSFEARKNFMQISWLHIQCAAS